MDHGYGPLSEVKRFSLTQLIKFSKAAEKRDRVKQAALIEAVMLGQDPKVAGQAIKDLLNPNATNRTEDRSQHKRNRKRSS